MRISGNQGILKNVRVLKLSFKTYPLVDPGEVQEKKPRYWHLAHCIFLLLFLSFMAANDARSQDITKADTTSKNVEKHNFYIVSVIKSVGGQKPVHEFFDFNVRLFFTSWLFSYASADIAISNVSTDSVGSTQDKFTEAGFSLNYSFTLDGQQTSRQLYVGPVLKIFNTVPYLGIHVGSMEIEGDLLSSFMSFGLLHAVTAIDTSFAKGISKNLFRDNFYIEFALHSKTFSLLKHLRVKGGLLLPTWWNKGPQPSNTDIVTRITIEVPLGTVELF